MAVSCLLFLILTVRLQAALAVFPADGDRLQYDSKKKYQLKYAPWRRFARFLGADAWLLWGMKEVLRGGIPPGVLAIIKE